MGCDKAYNGAKFGSADEFNVLAGCDCARNDPPGDPFATDDRRGLRRRSGTAAAEVDGEGGLAALVAPPPPWAPVAAVAAAAAEAAIGRYVGL